MIISCNSKYSIFRFLYLISKKIILVILSLFLIHSVEAEVYYVSSSQGNDLNNGLSIQTPFKSIEKLNSMNFNPEILFVLSPVIIGRVCFG